MRLNVHDFSGHPFQVELSRSLAARGHEVLHGFATQYVTGHGRLDVGPEDPESLRIEGLTCRAPMVKYSPVGRARFELSYASAWQAELERERFDVVVACNVPLIALDRMRRFFARRRQPWVMWHQDLYSLGVGAEAERKLPGPMAQVARTRFERMEAAQVRAANAVVPITEEMVRRYADWGVAGRQGIHVIPNWAPLDDVAPGVRDNTWARRHRLPEQALRLMYAGTLGRKHNPLLLLELLDTCRAAGIDAHLTVVSEGVGADDLAAAAGARDDLLLLGYQPADAVSDMLASADVSIALLEPDAAEFSVPSKVLTYLAAGRPILALVPLGNPCAADVTAAGGFAAPPSSTGVQAAATWLTDLATDRLRLARIGQQARALACQRFDIARITDRFEGLLAGAMGRPATTPAARRVLAAPHSKAAR